jgi:hypothetical protein
MPTTANQLDLSPLTPASRREIRAFYQFLIARKGRATKTTPTANTRSYTEFCGKLSWQGDAVASQRKIRDEW